MIEKSRYWFGCVQRAADGGIAETITVLNGFKRVKRKACIADRVMFNGSSVRYQRKAYSHVRREGVHHSTNLGGTAEA